MCGIIAYKGSKNASQIVIEGLKKLEYRGYDSWGIAYQSNPSVGVLRRVGKISEFNHSELPESNLAIAHTRWATHGGIEERNAHPQLS
ncbi:glutamine--fructose-6-phosphate aminotransferase, partial [Candidatus Woesearchaeota archaeon]|nr:glutamine--fructose-6-phosphate aminotransferase [Candidatus Woesearchaeota archaeon]